MDIIEELSRPEVKIKSKKRGFAAMKPGLQREIARKGGQTAHKNGTAHEFTPEEAREAGKRGGKIVSANRAWMSTIAKKGRKMASERKLAHVEQISVDNISEIEVQAG